MKISDMPRKLRSVRQLIHRKLRTVPAARRILLARRTDPEGVALVHRVRSQRLTYLEPTALLDLRDRARQMEQKQIQGAVMEAGCALGGSAVVLAASKARDRPMYVYDVFGTIPSPSDNDGADVDARYEVIASGEAKGIDGDPYYGYQPDLKGMVANTFTAFGVTTEENAIQLVEGLFQDTIYPAGPVALAHVDGDWYESVKVCLERIWPVLSRGGVIVIDDYDHWSGCRTAVDEFLAARPDCSTERWSRLHLVKA